MSEITTAKAFDLQGASAEELEKTVQAAGEDVYLNDGEGTVPNAEYRMAILKGTQVIGFFSPYVYELQTQRYWRAGPLYLAPEHRGQGHMHAILKSFFADNTPGLVWIDNDNAASIKLFVGLGFTRHSAWKGRKGQAGHWYTLVTPVAQTPDLGPATLTMEALPAYLRW